MKKLAAFIIVSLVVITAAYSQNPCLPEGITFTTQEEIDNFQANHPGCTEIEGNVAIDGGDITNLNGLSVLIFIGGDLHIGYYIGGSNLALTSLTGLEELTAIGGGLNIYSNLSLTGLAGLDNLTSIVGGLFIGYNDSLIGLTGLENLASIGGGLWIEGNNTLISLAGLETINAGTIENLYIWYNPSLSKCEVQSICEYLTAPGGAVEIHDNAPGCNSQQEVEDACLNSVDYYSLENSLTISPNPLKSSVAITYTLNQSSPVTINILDLSGRSIVTLVSEYQQQGEQRIEFNTTGLQAGIYFCVLKTNPVRAGQTAKLIKH